MTPAPTDTPKHCPVTGAAGPIGSHEAELLIEMGHEVLALDKLSGGFSGNVPEACRFERRSVEQPLDDIFAAFRPETVYHLAAYAVEGLQRTAEHVRAHQVPRPTECPADIEISDRLPPSWQVRLSRPARQWPPAAKRGKNGWAALPVTRANRLRWLLGISPW